MTQSDILIKELTTSLKSQPDPFSPICNKIIQIFVLILKENIEYLPIKLGFYNNTTKIKGWAVIKLDDEKMEAELIRTEAKVNALFYQFGYNVDINILEDSGNLNSYLPSFYREIKV